MKRSNQAQERKAVAIQADASDVGATPVSINGSRVAFPEGHVGLFDHLVEHTSLASDAVERAVAQALHTIASAIQRGNAKGTFRHHDFVIRWDLISEEVRNG